MPIDELIPYNTLIQILTGKPYYPNDEMVAEAYPDTVASDNTRVKTPLPVIKPVSIDAVKNKFRLRRQTHLTPEEEKEYLKWRKAAEAKLGFNLDLPIYDMRAFWKNSGMADLIFNEGFKFPDKYKTPSHPTFSRRSIYADIDGLYGGWTDTNENGVPYYTPNPKYSWEEELERMLIGNKWLKMSQNPYNPIPYYIP